jgi:hypothetical protein
MSKTNTAAQPVATIDNPSLMTILAALAFLRIPVKRQIVWSLIRRGKVSAVKIGREYFVDPQELKAQFAPRLRPVKAKEPKRESERARIERQLGQAGIATR